MNEMEPIYGTVKAHVTAAQSIPNKSIQDDITSLFNHVLPIFRMNCSQSFRSFILKRKMSQKMMDITDENLAFSIKSQYPGIWIYPFLTAEKGLILPSAQRMGYISSSLACGSFRNLKAKCTLIG